MRGFIGYPDITRASCRVSGKSFLRYQAYLPLMAEPQQSDALKNLFWFMIRLAILGTILALVLYYTVELPAQQALLNVPALNRLR